MLESAVPTPLTCRTVKFYTPALAIPLALLLAPWSRAAVPVTYSPSNIEPPWVAREFRGVWIATVANIDWPSKPGLSVEGQKRELTAILDRAVKLNLNAVVFQAGPTCDAMYDSKLVPWSYYLTGVMGRAPTPYYDPLAFAVEEAHKRGLELHAWFSPYRAGHPSQKPPFATNHVSRIRPDLVRKFGGLLWLDPGEKDAQDFSLNVIMDVVRRYDIDGVHFDDRLGYPEADAEVPKNSDFPDDATWKHYLAGGGKMSRDDWRRENVNTFVHRVYDAIKSVKPWVKFGIAPSGIWQQGNPPQIRGRSAYAVLYTDSRKWLMNGWLDYCSPQLYWAIAPPEQSFPVLLKWWAEQNPKHRNVWPGLDAEKTGGKWNAEEIVNQINITKQQSAGAAGAVLYSAKCLMEDSGGLATALTRGVYSKPALVPASPWLEQNFPAKPLLHVDGGKKIKWETAGMEEKISQWVLQIRVNNQWQTCLLPGAARCRVLDTLPDVVAITAVDRCGVASPPAVLQRDATPK